ncbi:MAG: hypothetical protein JXA20_02245 [Spirochaetes bacterium]|nr:hypothetical protein [Spirochaetota bacterium]
MNNRLILLLRNISADEIEAADALLERVEYYVSQYVKEKTSPAGRGKKR